MVTIDDAFDIRSGFTFRDSIALIAPGSVRVIQAGDINSGRVSSVPKIEFNGDKHLLQIGDILLSARGGTVARVVTADMLPAVVASSVMVLRPKYELNSRFVTRYLNSTTGQAALAKIASGAYIKTLRKAELSNLRIPAPPATTQKLLVELGEVVEQYKQTLRLKEDLLTDMFNQAIKSGGSST